MRILTLGSQNENCGPSRHRLRHCADSPLLRPPQGRAATIAARESFALRVNDRFFYGWTMLAVASLTMFASGPGQSHTFSVFLLPISEALGISLTSVSSAYAFATLVAAFGLPHLGRLVDRHGVRKVLTGVGVALGTAAVAFGAVSGFVLLTLGFAALRFFGQGSLMLCAGNLTSQWFDRKRGLALSLTMLGFSVSVAVHPPLAQWLTDAFGWRMAWVVMGAATWLLLLPPVLLLVFDRPEVLGLRPDGAAGDAEAARPESQLELRNRDRNHVRNRDQNRNRNRARNHDRGAP